ncbi:MAG: GAP family protein [Solirubrobacteraceae bacterium]|nr:GAP family protein [Solirubrobacteraceae bacterium]
MPYEAILLGLASAFRPTGIAAIYALLGSARPRRSLLLFLAAGALFSVTVGAVVVLALNEVSGYRRQTTVSGVVDLMIGAAALGFAAGVVSGRVGWSPAAQRTAPGWVTRLRDPSARILVVAGIATHLPGIFYLAGLHLIAVGRPGPAAGIAEVLVYNALWYSTGVAALVAFVLQPEGTRAAVEWMRSWLRDHERQVLVAVFTIVGVWFTGAGAQTILA